MKWINTLNLQSEYEKATDGEISHQKFAEAVAQKLRKLPKYSDKQTETQKNNLIFEFQHYADETVPGDERIDSLLDELYDWGDRPVMEEGVEVGKVCWINTF